MRPLSLLAAENRDEPRKKRFSKANAAQLSRIDSPPVPYYLDAFISLP